ncbi:hypothetical protein [Nocardia sp. BMG51109]|nr:hypothetical protein [Nocardia sp. BMG51109]
MSDASWTEPAADGAITLRADDANASGWPVGESIGAQVPAGPVLDG